MKKEVKKVKEAKEHSIAWEIIQDKDKTNQRMFVIWIITFIALLGMTCYAIYLSNDIGTIETTEEISQNNGSGSNNYIGNDGDIINGNSKD